MPIITTAEYKTYAGITDAAWDTRLGVLIPMVEAAFERYCGREFDETTYTDQAYDGNGERSLWLPQFPVTAVSAVKIKDSEGNTTTLNANDYRFTSEGELYRISGSYDSAFDYQRTITAFGSQRPHIWPDHEPANILVTYTAGYSTSPSDTMPKDLKGLLYILVDAAIDQAGENWMLAASGNGVETRTPLAPDMLVKRYGDLCRPWRGSGLAVP